MVQPLRSPLRKAREFIRFAISGRRGPADRRLKTVGSALLTHGAALLALALAAPGVASAHQRVHTLHFPAPPHSGAIGTEVDAISTAIRKVSIRQRNLVHRYGLLYVEVRGEVEGVGWGGVSRTGAFLQTHYDYRYPYVLRIPLGWDGTLVVHRHGTGPFPLWEGLEATLGERNFARRFHETADRLVSDAALHPSRRWAFFSVNQTPVAPGGAFNTLAISTDDPSMDSAPVHSMLDVPVGRDFALLAKRLLKALHHNEPRLTLGTGHSGGASVNFMLNAGLDPLRGATAVRAGDNFVRPYDSSSGKIYDGFISFARGGGPVVPVDTLRGLSAPTLFVEGEVDVGALLAVRQIDEVVAKGLDPAQTMRLYMVRNLPHVDGDLVSTLITEGRDFAGTLGLPEQFFGGAGERLKPLSGAMLDALHAWAKRGTPPPTSVFPGTALSGDATPGVDTLMFAQSTGDHALSFPYVDHPGLDVIVAPPPTSTENNPGLAEAWLRVRNALGAATGSIVLPETACRRGAFTFIASGPVGAWFTPFDESTFLSRWGNSAAHQTCRTETVEQLTGASLYDRNVAPIDILPHDFPNVIEVGSKGLLPVAILSTAEFDATRIIPGSVSLAGSSLQGKTHYHGPVKARRQDVNGDGRQDLLVEFRIAKLEFGGDVVADVWGWTRDLEPFAGSDVVELRR